MLKDRNEPSREKCIENEAKVYIPTLYEVMEVKKDVDANEK